MTRVVTRQGTSDFKPSAKLPKLHFHLPQDEEKDISLQILIDTLADIVMANLHGPTARTKHIGLHHHFQVTQVRGDGSAAPLYPHSLARG